MDAFRKIQLFFHRYFLKQQLKRQATAPRGVAYNRAREIGLFFQADDLDRREIVLAFAEKLRKKGKKVSLLGYFDHPVSSPNFTFPYFTRKDTDWALRPTGSAVQDFRQKRFDIWITADTRPHFFAEYLAALSPARLRVGPVTTQTECYELMVDTGRRDDLKFFLSQVEMLLDKTNSHHEEAA